MPTISTKRVRRSINLTKGMKGHSKVSVGFPAGVDKDIVMKAVFNNYGTTERVKLQGGGSAIAEVIPERPFLDNAVRDNRSKYGRLMRKSAPKIIKGETTITNVMQKLGIEATGDIQEEITSLRTPPNAPETIKRKGSSNPLIDSGEMRRSVTHKTHD